MMENNPAHLLRANAEGNGKAVSLCLPNSTGRMPVLTLSAHWSLQKLTLRLSPICCGTLTLSCGRLSLTQKLAPGEAAIPLPVRTIGIPIVDLGQQIPLHLEFTSDRGSSVFAGNILICDETVLCDLPCNTAAGFDSVKISTAANASADMTGFCIGSALCGNGLRLYDRYSDRNDATSNQTLSVRLSPVPQRPQEFLHFSCDIRICRMPLTVDPGQTPIGVWARGLCLILSKEHPVFFGIWRTPAGLCFFLNDGWRHRAVQTGHNLGEAFRLEVIWQRQTLTCVIDGIPLAAFSGPFLFTRAEIAPDSLTVRVQRRETANSPDDDFDLVLRNLSVTLDRTTSVLSSLSPLALIGQDLPETENDCFPLNQPLQPAKKLPSNAYGFSSDIRWESSAPAYLRKSGQLSRPIRAGTPVTLTAHLTADGKPVSERFFRFFVPAIRPGGKVLLRQNDDDPYTGAAHSEDCYLILNRNGNSVVYDAGKIKAITNAALTPEPGRTVRVDKSFFALYESNDNQTYRRIRSFSVLNLGNQTIFYNFRIQARYLKLHSVPGSVEAPIGGSLGRLFRAGSSDFLFEGEEIAVWEPEIPPETPHQDAVLSFRPDQLPRDREGHPIAFTGLRFLWDGSLLPHAVIDGILYLRLFALPRNQKLQIRILRNTASPSVQNPEEVFEIRYGTRLAAPMNGGGYWVNTVERMPDGDLLRLTADGVRMLSSRSQNAGHTWSDWQEIPGSRTVAPLSGGGLITDPERGLVLYIGHGHPDNDPKSLTQFVMRSTDSGKSWSTPQRLPALWKWALSYSDGIRLRKSKNGVDCLFSYCGCTPTGVCASSALYSYDAGNTWNVSKSAIGYGDLTAQSRTHNGEGGCSEETVYEQEDGTVVMWSRYETTADEPHFAVSHSHDSGITWEPARLGNLYTSNTQPLITVCRGIPIMLWGGNNAMGAASHMRFPLSVAYSEDGAESFHGIRNLIFASVFSELTNRYEVTNPDLALTVYRGVEHAYIVAKDYRMLIEDFGDCIFRTKGAYDDFSLSSPEAEGWVSFAGHIEVAGVNAARCMRLSCGSAVSRSLPQLENGCILLSLRMSPSASLTLELQTAYADHPGVAAPVTLTIRSEKCKAAQDTLSVPPDTPFTLRFDLISRQGLATLTCNGIKTVWHFAPECLPGVCYINLWSTGGTVDVLRLIAIDNDDHFPMKGTES